MAKKVSIAHRRDPLLHRRAAEGADILRGGALGGVLDQALLEDQGWGALTITSARQTRDRRAAASQATAPPQSWPTRVKRPSAERVGEREHVLDHLVGPVILDPLRPVRRAEAALVGHDQAEVACKQRARRRARCGAIRESRGAG